MKRNDDNAPDEQDIASSSYRALATERTPGRLDRKVLDMASQEVAGRSPGSWLSARIRPLAFVVTAGLALALLVQLNNAPVVDMPPISPGVEPLPENAFQDAARQTAEQIRQLDAGPDSPMPSPDPGMTPPTVAERPAALSLLPVEDRCNDTDRAESGTWWECIRDLEKRGLSESAELELQALLNAHPQFSAPQ